MAEAKKVDPDAVEFVALIGAALGEDPSTREGIAQIARKTGADKRYLYRWRAGSNAPSLRNIVSMLKSANLLRSPGEAAGEPGSPHQILQGLVKAVEELTESETQALADLHDVRTRLGEAEAALAPARGRRGKRGA